MSKQNLIVTIIAVISIVVGGLFGFYFYLSQKNGASIAQNISSSGFFNFGNSAPVVQPPSETSDTSTTTEIVVATIPKPIPVLRHLTLAPVAGFSFIDKDILASSTTQAGTTTRSTQRVVGSVEVVRWVDRATGNIYETSSSTLETARVSNTTIRKIYEAYFVDKKGSGIIFRDLFDQTDAIRTRYGKIQISTSSEQNLSFVDLPVNITSLTISPNRDQIFSILPGSTRGIISKPDGGTETNVFDSPFHEWLASWTTAQQIVLNTKPSGTAPGFAYILDTRTRVVSKIVGEKNGLTTLMSPDGLNVLIGESPQGTTKLSVLNRRSGETKDLFLRTFPEKCVWSKKEVTMVFCAVPENIQYDTYPDAWYMGRVSFSDSIWKINTATGESRLIVQPIFVTGQPLDISNMIISNTEDFLLFQDKNDLSLWSYQLVVPTSASSTTSSSL